MKKLLIILIVFAALPIAAKSQLLKKLANKVKDKTSQRADQKVDQTIDKGLDKTEDATKTGGANGKKPDDNGKSDDKTGSPQGPPTLKTYTNYDFIPGDNIIFESGLTDEQVGEIPSQFTLINGQMDVQMEDGEKVIHVPTGAGATITARMTNTSYMPDQFTIEFDFKNEKFGLNHIAVDFGSRTYYADNPAILQGLDLGWNSVSWTLGDVDYPKELNCWDPMKWHHVAIAVNKTVGKVYVDQFRVANVNNLTRKANNVTFEVNGYENSFIKNIRIAAGGIDIYKKVTTDGKIITHGILFDIDKATLKPESMGTINGINTMLKNDPSLKFEIDGHTDNSGAAAHNLTLSQDRADAVKAQLVSMGIDASRLTTKGFGDTKPISDNTNPEGKANNRRVEFVKM